jgi:hypothetical protein
MTLEEQAARRVAEGANSTIGAAVWAITHKAGYVAGRSDGERGTPRDITGASEGYAAGYARGYRWGVAHPLPVLSVAERPAPSVPGAAWVAPVEVRCSEHGRVACRRDTALAEQAAREHAAREH